MGLRARAAVVVKPHASTVGHRLAPGDRLRKSEAVAAFVYKDFIEGNLSESSTPQTYVNSAMQEDLKQGSGLAIATLFGNQTRYDGVNVRCALTADANLQAGTFSFRPDCLTIEGIPIAKKMNDLMAKGVVLTTGLEDGVGRCSISEAIVYDLGEGRANQPRWCCPQRVDWCQHERGFRN